MDRNWMYEKRTTLKYIQGVHEFIQYAEENKRKNAEDFITCPCCDCKNFRRYRNSEEVKIHLIRRGFKEGYNQWIWHGESLPSSTSVSKNKSHADSETQLESETETNSQTQTDNEENNETHVSNDEDDDRDQTSETSGSNPKETSLAPKRRGPNACKNLNKKKGKEEVSIQFDEYNRPVGLYCKEFKSYIGTLVRSRVDINIDSWPNVEQTLKETIWADVKKQFCIEDDTKKKIVLKIASTRWRDFKSRLRREHVVNKHPNYESPVQLYEYMTKEQWAKFVANYESESFKEKTKKARQRQACNVHPHFLGSAGYAGKRSEWMISDPLSSQSSCASVSSSLLSDDRSFDWVRARVKKSEEGSYYIPNEKTQEVFHKIVEKCDEVSEGTFQPNRHHDILSVALGKSEEKRGSGTVRGVGSYSTIRQVFGQPEQKRGTPSELISTNDAQKMLEKCMQATLLEVQPKIEMLTQQLNVLLKNMPGTHLYPQGVSVGTPQSDCAPCDQPPTQSSCHSVDVYPVTAIKENVKICSPRQNKQMRDQSVELSGTTTRPPIVGENVLLLLGRYCKRLVKALTSIPVEKEFIDLDIDQTVFHHTNVNGVFVMIEDIQDLLTMNWLDVSIIQVFMLFLNKLCKQLGVTSIGFACPTQISADMINLNCSLVTSYLIHVMDEHKDQQFILAPYHQDNHWVLIVICTPSKKVYVFDPMKTQRTLEVKTFVNMAFRSIPGRATRNVNWVECKCPQQPRGVECGYYVLRYMFDIITKYSMVESLYDVFDETITYSMNEIDEVRELWAQYFIEECV
ncbi:uncharacterized protein LOC116013770 [Ipomoea triloba]|uniref:uncharacterized protein LOC116013770 n=1 Tax=Ipomoea triloba TaxID=35885 RepID=UPI00125D80EA|nr:uncharacterized protein LOC116013770 [Ipomoea triloba]